MGLSLDLAVLDAAAKQEENAGPGFDVVLWRLRTYLQSTLENGYPDIGMAARAIDTSVRSLQRHLSQQGTCYSKVVARIRFQMASTRLLHSTEKLIDIALDLGYSDAAAFSRAFGRWAGIAPNQYRKTAVHV